MTASSDPLAATLRWFGLEIGQARLAVECSEVASVFTQSAGRAAPTELPFGNAQELLVHEGRPLLVLAPHDLFEQSDGSALAYAATEGQGDWVVAMKTPEGCSIGIRADRASGPFRTAADGATTPSGLIEHNGQSWTLVRTRSPNP